MLLAIKTHKLQRFLDGSIPPPVATVTADDGTVQENPEFTRYEQQDNALASCLLSSISQRVLPNLIGMDSNSQIWSTLANVYGSKTTSRLMFFRRALHSQKKGDVSMKEYLLKIKSFCDNLAGWGEVIGESEHATVILNGLSTEFEAIIKAIITVIIASPVAYEVQAITTMLLRAEARLSSTLVDVSASENVVTHQQNQSGPVSTPIYHDNIGYQRGRGRGQTNNRI